MTWWLWTLVWVALVAGALGVLFLLLRSLWRKGMVLARELAEAGERLSVVAAELESLSGTGAAEPAADAEPAVFRSPARLRAERIAARRGRARTGRARTEGGGGVARGRRGPGPRAAREGGTGRA
ncbi:MAG TPA: hypothetical protein VI248_22350 [Kineosporiaceae bacterium]